MSSSSEPSTRTDPAPLALPGVMEPSLRDLIEHRRLPLVEYKLVQGGIADSLAEADALLREVRRYLYLNHAVRPMTMYSALVDAAWHQFVQATEAYSEFCAEGWGRYLHHYPGEAPSADAARERDAAGDTFAAFADDYRLQFGAVPDCWFDERCLREHFRLVYPELRDEFSVHDDGKYCVLSRERGTREVVCRVSRRARPALDWIATHRVFVIRELPGLRDPAERVQLLAPLVSGRVLLLLP